MRYIYLSSLHALGVPSIAMRTAGQLCYDKTTNLSAKPLVGQPVQVTALGAQHSFDDAYNTEL